MGLVDLLLVASIPVMKVLLMTAVGLFLALDRIDILGEITRNNVNNLVFYVFNPALVGSNLANTITFDSFLLLWFMPINILFTFLIGLAFGWILIKITKPPQHLEGLILGCCSAGNLGNLPLIIIPALCKEKGSPFGDPDVCYKYGMAYTSLSMALGAICLWSIVYNIMRISSNKVNIAANASNGSSKVKSTEGIPESLQEKYSEALLPAKDHVDDAYTVVLLPAESEEKVKVPILKRFKHYIIMLSSNMNLQSMFAPSTTATIVGFILGMVPPLRSFIIGAGAPLRVAEDSASMLGDAAIPTVTLVMGANLLRGLKGINSIRSIVVGVNAVRYVFLPLVGVVIVKGAAHLGLVHSDPLYQFVLLLQYALPPAMNMGTVTQLFGAGESECSVIMLWTYALASIAVTLWSTFFMWLVA